MLGDLAGYVGHLSEADNEDGSLVAHRAYRSAILETEASAEGRDALAAERPACVCLAKTRSLMVTYLSSRLAQIWQDGSLVSRHCWEQ